MRRLLQGLALASVLVSRSFFNLEEGSPDEDRVKINDFELANRLSYFLWSSMPDALARRLNRPSISPRPMHARPHLVRGFSTAMTSALAAILWKRPAKGPRDCVRKPLADHAAFCSFAMPSLISWVIDR